MRSASESWRWWVTALLFLATTINYMDRVTLAGVSVRVSKELGLSNVEYGHLELAFGWAFAVGSLVFGFLADRIRIYLLYPVVLGAWSLMGMAAGWVESFNGLLVCRALLGFFEAAHWPCAVKTTFLVLDEKQRTLGNSILQSGASVGAVITPQVIRWLVSDVTGSWRRAFIVCGVFGFAWVLIWLVAMRSQSEGSVAEVQGGAEGSGAELKRILMGGRFWAVALLIVGAQTVWHVFRVWLMKFLQTGRGLEEAAALNFTSLYYLATDLGCIAAGFASIQLIRRLGCTPHAARRWVYATGCVCTSMSVFLPWLSAGVLLKAVLLVIGAGALALFPCYYSFVQELSAHHVGRLTGILSLWVWAVTSPMHSAFGKLADQTRSYDAGLVIAGLAPWLGVAAMKMLWRERAAAE